MTAVSIGNLPYGAREISDLRATGKRPADMVIVSMIGPLRESNPVVIAKPGRTYDWRFLTDLESMIVADGQTGAQSVRAFAKEISSVAAGVTLWRSDVQDGAWIGKRGAHPLMVADRIGYAGIGYTGSRADAIAMIARSVKAKAIANADRVSEPLREIAFAGLKALFGKAWSEA